MVTSLNRVFRFGTRFSSSSARTSSKNKNKLRKSTHFSYLIQKDSVLGQQWVAAKSLSAGTIVINEKPAMITPRWTDDRNTPICLSCGHQWNGHRRCSSCGWPVCGPECEYKPVHADNECKIFQESKIPYPPPGNFEMTDILLLVGLLRGGQLRYTDPYLFEEIMKLRDVQDLKDCNKMNFLDSKIFCEKLKKILPITPEETKMYRKIYRVNSINSYSSNPSNSASCSFAMVYPKVSRINHSCSPTCRTTIAPFPDLTMRIVTSIDVDEGQPLTVAYMPNTNELGTRERQKVLRHPEQGACFICKCERCTDPTECGTMMSAITCDACLEKMTDQDDLKTFGYFLPVDPLLLENDIWKCNKCGDVIEGSIILSSVSSAEDLLELTTVEHDLEFYQNLIKIYSGHIFHPNHYIIQRIVRRIVDILEDKSSPSTYVELVKHYFYLLEIENKISPGYNTQRIELMLKASGLMLSMTEQQVVGKKKKIDKKVRLALELCGDFLDEAYLCDLTEWPSKKDMDHIKHLQRFRTNLSKLVR